MQVTCIFEYLSSRTCDPKIAVAAVRGVLLALEWITHTFDVAIAESGDSEPLEGK